MKAATQLDQPNSKLRLASISFLAGLTFLATPTAFAQDTATAKQIEVTTAKAQDVQIWNSFSGRISAVDAAEIRPQVGGRITKIHFKDGQYVEADDLLLEIDPRPFEASVKQAKAELENAKSQAELAKRELARAKKLLSQNTVAQRQYDERETNAVLTKNAVLAAEAALLQAEIDLEHALVKAPISGRISRAELTVGNLVQSGPNAPLLTSIVATEHVYAEFDVDENTYLNHVHKFSQSAAALKMIPIKVSVGSQDLTFSGTIYSFDNQINPETGTIRARALIANPEGALLPGMYAQIQMANPDELKSFLIPEQSIGTDQDRRFVYILNNENKAEYREVKLGQEIDDTLRIINSGLQLGEKIIISNIGMIRPGTEIDPASIVVSPVQKTAALAVSE